MTKDRRSSLLLSGRPENCRQCISAGARVGRGSLFLDPTDPTHRNSDPAWPTFWS